MGFLEMKKISILSITFALLITSLCACSTPAPAVEENNDTVQSEVVVDNNTNNPIETEPTPADEKESPSVFDMWIEEENSPSERSMYEALIEGFIIADDEISRGWIDEETKAFLRVLKGNFLPLDASTKEYMSAYRDLDANIGTSNYCIRDFFTVDEYEYSTSMGIYNFLRAIDQLENEKFDGKDVVTTTTNNVIGWDFDIVGGDGAIAKALGISEELVIILQHAAIDSGFTVTFSE